jgi:hypothetical protein
MVMMMVVMPRVGFRPSFIPRTARIIRARLAGIRPAFDAAPHPVRHLSRRHGFERTLRHRLETNSAPVHRLRNERGGRLGDVRFLHGFRGRNDRRLKLFLHRLIARHPRVNVARLPRGLNMRFVRRCPD